jgi:hypothetical protein
MAIARLSLYDLNRDAFARCDTAVTLLRWMDAAPPGPSFVRTLEWGHYAVLSLTAPDATSARDTARAVVEAGGVALIAAHLTAHGATSPHLARWAATGLAHLIGDDKNIFDVALDYDACGLVHDLIQTWEREPYPLVGALQLLRALIALESYEAAVDLVQENGTLATLISALTWHVTHHAQAEPLLVEHLIAVLWSMLRARPADVKPALLRSNTHEVALRACRMWTTEAPMRQSAAALLLALEVPIPDGVFEAAEMENVMNALAFL